MLGAKTMKRWGDLQRKQFNREVEQFCQNLAGSRYRIYPRYLDRVSKSESDLARRDRAVVLASYPPARTNKYQYLLYKQAVDHGFHVLPISAPEDLESVPWPGDLIFHIHWTADVLKPAKNEAEARHLCNAFIDYLLQLKTQRGIKLLWTAHNLLPHGARYIEVEKNLRKRMIDIVDGIHLLTENSRSVLRRAFYIEEDKTFVVRHSNYRSAYANFSSQNDARAEIGINQDSKVLLLFGALSEYKGIDFLIDNFDSISAQSAAPLHLVFAGGPANDEVAKRIESYAAGRQNVTADLRKIPDDQVHFYFNAADVVLTPYVEGLNSGVQLLGLTFDKPVLAPRDTNMAELDSPLFHTCDVLEVDSFSRAVDQVISHTLSDDELKQHSRFLDALDPSKCSHEFFEKLSKLMFH